MESAVKMKQLLEEYRIPPGSDAALKLSAFLALLTKWNLRMNLTASNEWYVLGPLFGEALWARSFYPDSPIRHLDIGSGAGFPIIPIRLLSPCMRLDLVESRAKRVVFLETAAAELGLEGTEIHEARLDGYLRSSHKTWDSFSWKGLKLGREELELLLKHAHSHSRFYMFHGREPAVLDRRAVGQELTLLQQADYPGRKEWKLSIFCPR